VAKAPSSGFGLRRIAGGGALVWVGAAAAALAAHGAIALIAFRQQEPTAGLPTPPAILLDLAPLPAAPAAPQTQAAPDRLDAPEIPEAAAPELTARTPPPAPPRLEPPEPPEPLALPEAPAPRADLRPKPRPVRIAEPERKARPLRIAEPEREARPPSQAARAPQAATPRQAPVPVAPRETAGRQGAAYDEAWRSRIMAHLQRRMIYPPAALEAGVAGTAVVNIRLDTAGKVTGAKLVRSSGDRALDAAALTAVRLASPLPKPPPGQNLEVTAPLRYNQRATP
jgi:protein TonB